MSLRALSPVAALLLSASILLSGQGLQFTLLPVRASLEDFSTVAIGAMGAAYFFGFTVGCLKSGELLRRVGHIRVFLAMSAVASAVPLVHGLVVEPVVWGVLRFLTGFCLASLYIVIESWLNERSTNANRGVIFSTYSMITLTMMAAGQMMNLLYNPVGLQLFVISSILFSIGAVPIALSVSPSPAQPASTKTDIRNLFHTSPSGASLWGWRTGRSGALRPCTPQRPATPFQWLPGSWPPPSSAALFCSGRSDCSPMPLAGARCWSLSAFLAPRPGSRSPCLRHDSASSQLSLSVESGVRSHFRCIPLSSPTQTTKPTTATM